MASEQVDIAITADTREAKAAFADAEKMARGFSSALSSAFIGVAVKGKDLGDVISQLGLRLSQLALNMALKPLESGVASLFQNILGGGGGTSLFAKGGVIGEGRVLPFAKGGVVASPSYFPLAGGAGLGLMGEKGAEAILPLARGADGALGVRTEGGRGANVVVNVTTPDVASFRRSDAYLSGLVARAVTRAQRQA